MKGKGKKAAGVVNILAGIVGLLVGIIDGSFAPLSLGIGLIIIGSSFFYKKAK